VHPDQIPFSEASEASDQKSAEAGNESRSDNSPDLSQQSSGPDATHQNQNAGETADLTDRPQADNTAPDPQPDA
jgi:hypothetical protein